LPHIVPPHVASTAGGNKPLCGVETDRPPNHAGTQEDQSSDCGTGRVLGEHKPGVTGGKGQRKPYCEDGHHEGSETIQLPVMEGHEP
jgi:hypothetical protein